MSKVGRKLDLFVLGDEPSGLKKIDLSNWIGLAFMGSRQHLADVRGRDELSHSAIYLLLADDGDDGDALYVGETENFIDRLSQHAQSKDMGWWDTFIVFVSKDQSLNKAHVKYLERRVYLLAKQIIEITTKNSKEPGGAKLSESDEAYAEAFLGEMQYLLEALGFRYLSPNETQESAPALTKPIERTKLNPSKLEGIEFEMTLSRELGLVNGNPYTAKMVVKNGAYILKAGSSIRAEATESFQNQHGYFSQWSKIVGSDAVRPTDNKKVLQTTKDLEFRAPSGAGAIVRARATDGRSQWIRMSDHKTLAEIEAEQLKEG